MVLGGGKETNPGALFPPPKIKIMNECFTFGRKKFEQRAEIFAHTLRAGRPAPTWVSSKIWYLYRAIDFVNLYKLKTVTIYPTAPVGESLLARLECANRLYRNEKGISA